MKCVRVADYENWVAFMLSISFGYSVEDSFEVLEKKVSGMKKARMAKRHIKNMIECGVTMRDLCKEYKVNESNLSRLLAGKI